jgi:hypothetical protein
VGLGDELGTEYGDRGGDEAGPEPAAKLGGRHGYSMTVAVTEGLLVDHRSATIHV